ncbi:MAG: OmpA family protein [Alphaproteobacteria bacterium]|nr:MAG: OmpA family protein [Alphaproteobacteria bacterium]
MSRLLKAAAMTAGLLLISLTADAAPSARLCAELTREYGVTPTVCKNVSASPARAPAPAPVRALTAEERQDNVFFPAGGTRLDDAARAQVRLLARVLKTRPLADACLRLVGHTDAAGDAELNRRVGLDRALQVGQALVAEGLDEARLTYASAGEDAPLEGLPASAPENRRVTIEARRCPGLKPVKAAISR